MSTETSPYPPPRFVIMTPREADALTYGVSHRGYRRVWVCVDEHGRPLRHAALGDPRIVCGGTKAQATEAYLRYCRRIARAAIHGD